MKTNHDACHPPMSSQNSSNIQIANFPIKSSTAKKLLEINLDNDLKFDIHVESICPKANRKVNVLARIANYMELHKRTILMNLFLKVQFHYFPAIWMFHDRALNDKINYINVA